jgi:hypothetical protein
VALERGDTETASDRTLDAVEAFREVGDPDGVAEALEGLAAIAAARGAADRSVRLAAAGRRLGAEAAAMEVLGEAGRRA